MINSIKNILLSYSFLFKYLITLNIVLFILVFGQLSGSDFNILINSDTLYLSSVYNDLFIDKNNLCGWNITAFPNLFPDALIYFALMAITNSTILSSLIFPILQYIIIALLLHKIFNVLSPHKTNNYIISIFSSLLLSLFLFVEIFDDNFEFTFQLLANSYHLGAFVNSLIALLLFLKYLKTSKLKFLLLLFLICFLAVFCDKIFIVIFGLPAFISSIIFLILWKQKKFFFQSITLFLALSSGMYLYNWASKSSCIRFALPNKEFAFDNISNSFEIFIDQLYNYSTNSNILLCIYIITICSFLLLIFHLYYKIKFYNKSIIFPFYVFSILFLLSSLLAPIINGSYTGYDTIRYNYSYYVYGVLVFPYLIINYLGFKTKRKLILIGLIIHTLSIVTIYINNPISKNIKDLINYYPDHSKSIDIFSNKYKLKNGIGNYWFTKLSDTFSRKGIKTFSVFNDGTPNHHASNENWFYGNQQTFNFIIYKDSNQLKVITDRLGLKKDDYILDKNNNTKICITPLFSFKREGYKPMLLKKD